jgi:hypothetical protein
MGSVRGVKYFSVVDMRSGYNQIRITDEVVRKTNFRTRFGSFEFLVVPFGLSNAPPIFQSVMNYFLCEYLNDWCIVYLDDILIHSQTPEEHLEHIELVFKKNERTQAVWKAQQVYVHAQGIGILGSCHLWRGNQCGPL